MTTHEKFPRADLPTADVMNEDQARLLARLSQRYAEALTEIRDRTPQTSVPTLLHAVHAHQVRRMVVSHPLWRKAVGETEVPEDRADDVAAALALLQVARDDLENLETGLLLAARTASSRPGKPLLTFKQIAAALGVESEQAAQGRYRRRGGTPNATASGIDGTR